MVDYYISGLYSALRTFSGYVVFAVTGTASGSACFVAASFFSIRIYFCVRRRLRKFAIAAVYLYLVFVLGFLPGASTLLALALSPGYISDSNHLILRVISIKFLLAIVIPMLCKTEWS